MIYLLPVGPDDLNISRISIKWLFKTDQSATIYVVSSIKHKDFFNNQGVVFLNEDMILNGLTIDNIQHFFTRNNIALDRMKWYFQQFIKMAFSLYISDEWYVILCADTIKLTQDSPLTPGWPYLFTLRANAAEKHYYDTYKFFFSNHQFIDYTKSYVTENLTVNTSIMRLLICEIESVSSEPFYKLILDYLYKNEIINKAGFAEYLTYSLYAMNTFPDLYRIKHNTNFRNGRSFFSLNPKEEHLKWVSKSYRTISFEKWDNEYYYNITNMFFPFLRLIKFSHYLFVITLPERILEKFKRIFSLKN